MKGHLEVHKKNTRFSYKPQRNYSQFGKTENKTMNTYNLVSK